MLMWMGGVLAALSVFLLIERALRAYAKTHRFGAAQALTIAVTLLVLGAALARLDVVTAWSIGIGGMAAAAVVWIGARRTLHQPMRRNF